jgi:hypothetical protein
LVLKDWLESTFLGQCKVFVSSDPDDIPAGTKWLDKINGALDDSKLLVILYSPQSKLRPWINFEAGCGWAKNIPIMPICHSGLKVGEIGAPISNFQGLEMESKDFVSNFFGAIAMHAGFPKTPRIASDEFLKELNIAIGQVEHVVSHEQSKDQENSLSEEQIKILQSLAKDEDSGGHGVDERFLASRVGLKVILFKHHIQPLVDKEYVYETFRGDAPTIYSISRNGINYLVSHKLHE